MKLAALILCLSVPAFAYDVPLATTGRVQKVQAFTGLRFTGGSLTLRGSALGAELVVVPYTSNLVGVARRVQLSDAELAVVVPNYQAIKASAVKLFGPSFVVTFSVDRDARFFADVPGLVKGCWRRVRHDEAWLTANGVDCASIRIGVSTYLYGP